MLNISGLLAYYKINSPGKLITGNKIPVLYKISTSLPNMFWNRDIILIFQNIFG